METRNPRPRFWAAALLERAAADWRVVPWLVGAASIAVLPVWFAVFREAPQSRLKLPSPRPEAPAPMRAAPVKADLSGPPVIPEVFARINPARTPARPAPPGPDRQRPGPRSADGEAASVPAPGPAAARQGGGLEAHSRSTQFTDALPSRLASSVRTEAIPPGGVPLVPFSKQNRADPRQTEERALGAAALPGRAAARGGSGQGAAAGAATGGGQASAPAGPASGSGAAGPGAIGGGQAASAGSPQAASGLTASGLESVAAPSHAAGAAAMAAAGAAAAGAAGDVQGSIAASAECARTSSHYTPIIQRTSQEMLALNNQAISCGPTIKCSFASHQYCTEPDSVPLWWKGYYESRCACARKHCAVRDKCEEVNSLNCQQLHACPITANKPCTRSPCDY